MSSKLKRPLGRRRREGCWGRPKDLENPASPWPMPVRVADARSAAIFFSSLDRRHSQLTIWLSITSKTGTC